MYVTAGLRANHRSSVPANIVERMERSVVVSDDEDRVGIDLEREIIPRLRQFTGMPGKQPARLPDTFDVQAVQLGIAIKLTRQRPT